MRRGRSLFHKGHLEEFRETDTCWYPKLKRFFANLQNPPCIAARAQVRRVSCLNSCFLSVQVARLALQIASKSQVSNFDDTLITFRDAVFVSISGTYAWFLDLVASAEVLQWYWFSQLNLVTTVWQASPSLWHPQAIKCRRVYLPVMRSRTPAAEGSGLKGQRSNAGSWLMI